ncbi:putative mitochondrial PUF nine target 1 [Leptomonas pyrrhocoris]|uniref:Putative mitochondrial PUF nine target 1 n=1 Tax=Leptomonas pyrrhocoris TaxID=157538 RepID=A0A0M9FVZ1_LEPPY|nr:putative mitochondrial PUF nine target 1 [Leptomonas pyrrhocoris]XP_015655455.1 putative mitochondrial PUF nine target 1 [Leptomonas pyrrhocoris]XP_015655456.1 putative mitochondrial PUF nine target 1 [Leptomonas pyrrhocoris]KPA77015.1 putative mitochondrial PUF nine target 1 [Leptomonas pyrrhocoris]KPA77016.1 putative mitochondrial PUF nine target 1 [Leptomonas pyrrhocoris]KPA77017.1 putative mitochondrial PUF nine target 1 [Leptomonas pyrrhocoris]|eukprot:XP_015655454.1 putative mitochondrial PUF nine target 1 [Leptomonas pyrrhocoris]
MAPKRAANRLLVLCASINDVTAWPFWKFLQMKKIKGVTDMALLAFNSDGGSFEARIDGERYHLKNYAKVRGYQQDMFENFVQRWHDPGRSYFVYGGHGMGDYVELEQNRVSLQVHELASIFGKRTFEAILFDACFMSNLDCAYHLRHNTRYIGASEGYMWEPDTALDYHIFNTHNASAMSRFKDPLHILRTVQADYCGKALRGDFSVLDTTHVAELRRYVQEHVIQRVYDRATFYSLPQQERLKQQAEAAAQAAIAEFGHPGGDANMMPGLANGIGQPHIITTPGSLALPDSGRPSRKLRLLRAIQFEHALYPSEAEDKQLLDLKSYLTDMEQEAQQRQAWEAAASGPQRRIAAGRRRVRSDAVLNGGSGGGGGVGSSLSTPSSTFAVFHPAPSRALFVDRQGRLPAAAPTRTAATDVAAVGALANAVPTTAPKLTALSPGYKGSAQEGLDLFHKVVVSHTQPKAAAIYAAHLGGLSFTVHEFSGMSRPVEPWVVESRRLLKRRAKLFVKNGELAEVETETPKPHAAAAVMSRNVLTAVDSAKAACVAAAAGRGASGAPSPPMQSPCTAMKALSASSTKPSASGSTAETSLPLPCSRRHRSSSGSSAAPLTMPSLSVYASASIGPTVSSQAQRPASYTPTPKPNSHQQTGNC